MTEHRIKSGGDTSRTGHSLEVDTSWSMILDDTQPLNRCGSPCTALLENGDSVVIGVSLGALQLQEHSLVLVGPDKTKQTLDLVTSTDGHTVELNESGNARKVNVKIVDENDLPDDG